MLLLLPPPIYSLISIIKYQGLFLLSFELDCFIIYPLILSQSFIISILI